MRNKYYLLTIFVLALDYATKWGVQAVLDRPVELIDGYLRLSRVRNSGVAFGLFADNQAAWKPYALAGLAVIAVVVIFIYAARMPEGRRLLQCGLATTMGGILGNFVDRISHGYVVDFIEFHIHDSFYWPT